MLFSLTEHNIQLFNSTGAIMTVYAGNYIIPSVIWQELKECGNRDKLEREGVQNVPILYTAFLHGPPHLSSGEPTRHSLRHSLSSSAGPYRPYFREHKQNWAFCIAAYG